MKEYQQICDKIITNIEQVIVGKRMVIENTLICFIAGGHLLLEDVPGVGKTILARSLAVSSGSDFRRIQCTPDLLPKDVTGFSIYDQKTGDFRFRPGPVFSQVILVDEINRATPRTQSGLLECMAEGQATIDGVTRRLPTPFFVLATQNPIEFDGTFPLPEAQLDRFMMKLSIGYPTPTDEVEILNQVKTEHPIQTLESVINPAEILKLSQLARQVFVDPEVSKYLVEIVTRTRDHSDLVLGVSPRGSIDLYHCAQARALLLGRDYVIPEDIKELAPIILSHRIKMRSESRLRGRSGTNLIKDILEQVEVPVVREG